MSTKSNDDLYWKNLEQKQHKNKDEIYKEFPLGTRVKFKKNKTEKILK